MASIKTGSPWAGRLNSSVRRARTQIHAVELFGPLCISTDVAREASGHENALSPHVQHRARAACLVALAGHALHASFARHAPGSPNRFCGREANRLALTVVPHGTRQVGVLSALRLRCQHTGCGFGHIGRLSPNNSFKPTQLRGVACVLTLR